MGKGGEREKDLSLLLEHLPEAVKVLTRRRGFEREGRVTLSKIKREAVYIEIRCLVSQSIVYKPTIYLPKV